MGDLDGVADAIKSLSRKIDGIGRPRFSLWLYVQLGATAFIMGAGCAAYIGFRTERLATKEELATVLALVRKQDATILELRRIIAMQREDPKAFPRLKSQFKAIDEYELNSTHGGSGKQGD